MRVVITSLAFALLYCLISQSI